MYRPCKAREGCDLDRTGAEWKRPRSGLTLLELLIGMSVMVMIMGALGGLASAVRSVAAYSEGRALATQHGRVAIERITRTVEEAVANERFPGFIVLDAQEGEWRFPDTLVVWHPEAGVLSAHPERKPLDHPERLPYHDELVVFCPHPDEPNRLIEIHSGRDVAIRGHFDALDVLRAEIQVFKASMKLDAEVLLGGTGGSVDYPAYTLTERMRTAVAGDSASSGTLGAVRFESLLRPGHNEWKNSDIAWELLGWAQGMCGAKTAVRQARLRVELQLTAADVEEPMGGSGPDVVAFFGSAALYYPMHKERRP